MNHRVRARGVVDRTMPGVLQVRDGKRWLRVDVEDWREALRGAVYRALVRCEKEARKKRV